jgi:hypothetical protein
MVRGRHPRSSEQIHWLSAVPLFAAPRDCRAAGVRTGCSFRTFRWARPPRAPLDPPSRVPPPPGAGQWAGKGTRRLKGGQRGAGLLVPAPRCPQPGHGGGRAEGHGPAAQTPEVRGRDSGEGAALAASLSPGPWLGSSWWHRRSSGRRH